MPPRRNKENFQQPTNFERGKIISLREGGFSYRAIGACVQRDSSTVMRIWKQWIDEYQTTRKTGSGRRKVTSARDDRHLLRMTVNDRTGSSRKLAARWSTAPGVLMSASSIPRLLLHRRGLRARVAWGAISYHERSNLLRIEGNLNSNRYVREVLQPEVIPFLHDIPGAIFHQHNARSHASKTVRDFYSDQHMQLLPWPAYSTDMSPIEHVLDLVGRLLARDPFPAASKDELLLSIQAM
ncbi:transposable element Tc1 transposase [Trichonephila clavipes]|nr:transposable element Tc1 transposase [Trichonephila clavipes]